MFRCAVVNDILQDDTKVKRPFVVTFLDQTDLFEWCGVKWGSKDGQPKNHVFKRNWTTCSKFVNHSNLSYNQHKWNLYDQLISPRIFT